MSNEVIEGNKLTLGDLENGDVFVHRNNRKGKHGQKFVVYGNPQFNIRHGSATRMCRKNGEAVSKSCRLEVIKIGNSVFKEKIMAMFSKPVLNNNSTQ
jgi:hypothetical protein